MKASAFSIQMNSGEGGAPVVCQMCQTHQIYLERI